MRLEVVKMTPSAASALLSASIGQAQRKLDENRVNSLANAIERGQWRTTHQAIAVDTDGVVIDGQHRLSAIVKSGKTVEVLVAWDSAPETFDVIDIGRARSAANILHIAGYGDSNFAAAAGRLIQIYDRLAGTTKTINAELRGEFTPHDILAVMEGERGDRLMSYVNDGQRIGKALGRSGARNWLAVAFAIIEESGAAEELRTTFMEGLETGAMLPSTSPILALRRWVMSGDTGYVRIHSNIRSLIAIATTLKAWNYWLSGKSTRQMAFKVGVEKIPFALAHKPLPGQTVDDDGLIIFDQLEAETSA